jgi:hypothetical protein
VKEAKQEEKEAWCACCGYPLTAHPDFDPNSGLAAVACDINSPPMTELPLLDIESMLSSPSPRVFSVPTLKSLLRASSAQWVEAVDPALTVAVRDVACSLGVGCVTTSTATGLVRSPSTRVSSKAELYSHLAPYALLAAVTKFLVGDLVKGGLEVMHSGATRMEMRRKPRGRQKAEEQRDEAVKMKMLVPNHILQWLRGGSLVGHAVGRIGVKIGVKGGIVEELCSAVKREGKFWKSSGAFHTLDAQCGNC